MSGGDFFARLLRPRLIADERTLLGVWAALAAAHRGLVPSPDLDATEAWWSRAAASLHRRCGSGLFADPAPVPAAVFPLLAEPAVEAAADPGLLGDAYAAGLASGDRRAAGQYYTPGWLVDAALDGDLEGDVIDPACGGGRFLLGAWRRLRARLPAEVALRRLHGVDLDPLAVAVCRAALALAVDVPGPLDLRVECGDPLLGLAARRGLAVDPALRPLPLEPGGFARVVGNPPYRAGRLGGLPAPPALYRAAFTTAEYQIDPYPLFLELGMALLAPGGRLSMVVPNAWLSNLRTGALRTLLVGHHRLRAVVEVPPEAFDAGVECVVVHVDRDGDTAPEVPVTDVQGRPRGVLVVEPDRPEAPLPLARGPRAVALLRAARSWTATLGDVAEVTRGVNPYHHTTHTPEEIAGRVHHADHRVGQGWVPELRGADLGAYRLWWAGNHWIHYGPWLKEPRAPRFFTGSRLVVRKILGETLCAAWLQRPLCCDQSVYVARLYPDQPWPPGALLAIVSSRLVAALLRARHQEDDRLFPQLKVRELRALPLPPADPADEAVRALAELALALQTRETRRFARAGKSPAARARLQRTPDAEADALRAVIEEAVCQLYGVALDAIPSTDQP